MNRKVDDLFDYVEERCLWQFHSRSQDRTRNIDGVIAKAIDLLGGRQPEADTPAGRRFVADAKILAADSRTCSPRIREAGEAEVAELLGSIEEVV